ncbi:MAG: hypothetical protein QME78_11950 [Thermodesulfobacteriota bacterium]|nr:hypothetical protein [Thermodesulfobacteriota bacterium]
MKRLFYVLAIGGVILVLASPVLLKAAGEKQGISLIAPPQVQVLQIEYYLKVIKQFAGGKPALHFEVKIKNISEKAERFSVMVTTPDGASAAGFIPAKAKKAGDLPVLQPKEEGKIMLPLMTENFPSSFAVEVETAPVE